MFLDNMSLAFDKSTVVKEYKEKIEVLQNSNDSLAKKVGNLTVEKDFLVEKLKSLVLKYILYIFRSKTRKKFVDTKHELSLNQQCKLLHIAKSTLYYEAIKRFSTEWDIKYLNELNEIHSEFPYYGTRRLVTALENEGYWVGRKLIKSAMEYMGIRALYPKHKIAMPLILPNHINSITNISTSSKSLRMIIIKLLSIHRIKYGLQI